MEGHEEFLRYRSLTYLFHVKHCHTFYVKSLSCIQYGLCSFCVYVIFQQYVFHLGQAFTFQKDSLISV